MRTLDHERLEVYHVARELSCEVRRIVDGVPKYARRSDLLDQVLRAASSIPMNIAEGSSETLPRRKAYFYRIARTSATELAAGLDHMVDMRLIIEPKAEPAKKLIVRIVSMLYKLTSSVKMPTPRKSQENRSSQQAN